MRGSNEFEINCFLEYEMRTFWFYEYLKNIHLDLLIITVKSFNTYM